MEKISTTYCCVSRLTNSINDFGINITDMEEWVFHSSFRYPSFLVLEIELY